MTDTITIGKRLIPASQSLVEVFDPAANPRFESDKPYRARVVLVGPESVLTEVTPSSFAEAYGFRMLPEDAACVNPTVHFQVKSFAPGGGFEPTKPYATRLLWRDLDGNTQSKLLLTKPDHVLAIAVHGKLAAETAEEGEQAPVAAVSVRQSHRLPLRYRRTPSRMYDLSTPRTQLFWLGS
jgi:hypothetical protein